MKKTEFVQIFNTVSKGIKPEIIEVMVSKNEMYHLELIEEPLDYRKIIEEGYEPEIVKDRFGNEIEMTLCEELDPESWRWEPFFAIRKISKG